MRRTFILSSLLAVATAIGADRLLADDAIIAALRGSETYPDWSKPRRVPLDPGQTGRMLSASRRSAADMRQTVAKLRYAVASTQGKPEHPFYLFQLARHWVDLDEDKLAWPVIQSLLDLPPATPLSPRFPGLGNLSDLEREASFLKGRILARNRLTAEALAVVESMQPRHGYDRVRSAEILAMAGADERAGERLREVDGKGHPDGNFSDLMIRLRGCCLAKSIGDSKLAAEIAQPVLDRVRGDQKWPQWQSAWSIMKKAAGAAVVNGVKLRDGTYSGSCRGFVADIEVTVEVRDGRVRGVEISDHEENRPWSALESIPKRLQQSGSGRIDAVSGATVSSCAIITAAEQAIAQAARKSQ